MQAYQRHATYHLAALELLEAELIAGKQARLHVTGYSMAPLLLPDDVVVLERAVSTQLRRGDIVTARHHQRLITHRLVAGDERGWHTKGDNAKSLDPVVEATAILGRVVAIEQQGVHSNLRTPAWLAFNRLLGLIAAGERATLLACQAIHQWLFGRTALQISRRWTYAGGVPFSVLLRILVSLAVYARGK